MKPLISVIVPVYNSEKYLEYCLNSILLQTYSNLEIILVDDGSTDKSSEICDEYQKKDARIKVIHKPNGGVSSARNLGIKQATGEYIGFLDSDDFIEKKMFETLLRTMLENQSDLVICEVYRTQDYEYIEPKEKKYETKFLSNMQAYKLILGANGPEGFLVNKLYKREIITKNAIFLNEKIHICEDLLFNCEYLQYCTKISYTTEPFYYYIYRDDSAINNTNRNEKWLSIVDAYDEMEKIYKKIGNPEYYDLFLMSKVWFNEIARMEIKICHIDSQHYFQKCSEVIEENFKYVLKSKYVPMNSKIKLFIYHYFWRTIVLLKTIKRRKKNIRR